MRHLRFVLVFAVGTLLVWGTRINNIWSDQDLDTGAQLIRTALAASFVVLALVVLAAVWRAGHERLVQAVALLAGWTAVVWVVRASAILLGDWSFGFKVVHTLLAAGSIALGAVALREVRRRQAEEGLSGAGSRPGSESSGEGQ